MLVALNAKESVDWDRLRISVCCLSLVAGVCADMTFLGQGTCLSSREAREPVEREADHKGCSAPTYESQRTAVRCSSCTKTALDCFILACKRTLFEHSLETGCAPK